MTYGGRTVAAVNASALHFVGTGHNFTDPYRTVWFTYVDGQVQVRFRDHGAGIWHAPNGVRLRTVDVD